MPATKRSQVSTERQRGFQLVDQTGKPVHNDKDELVIEIIYAAEPIPTDPADGTRWVKVWDNLLQTQTNITPWSDELEAQRLNGTLPPATD